MGFCGLSLQLHFLCWWNLRLSAFLVLETGAHSKGLSVHRSNKLPLALASPSFLQPLIFGELVSHTYAQVHFYSELFDGFHMAWFKTHMQSWMWASVFSPVSVSDLSHPASPPFPVPWGLSVGQGSVRKQKAQPLKVWEHRIHLRDY